MTARELSADGLAAAKIQLRVIHAMKAELDVRNEHRQSPEFEQLSGEEQLAYLVITDAIGKVIIDRVDRLNVFMGSPDSSLAEIEASLTDGNYRLGK